MAESDKWPCVKLVKTVFIGGQIPCCKCGDEIKGICLDQVSQSLLTTHVLAGNSLDCGEGAAEDMHGLHPQDMLNPQTSSSVLVDDSAACIPQSSWRRLSLDAK